VPSIRNSIDGMTTPAWIDLYASFFHHLLELAVADRIRHIPAHAPEDDLSLKMTAFEIDHRGAPATKPPRIIGAAGNRAQVCDRTTKRPSPRPSLERYDPFSEGFRRMSWVNDLASGLGIPAWGYQGLS
jgi:hypothetical protein